MTDTAATFIASSYVFFCCAVVVWLRVVRSQRRLIEALKAANTEKDGVIVGLMKARIHDDISLRIRAQKGSELDRLLGSLERVH